MEINIFGYQVMNNDRLCSLNDDKIIHTLKILTYTRAYLSCRVQLTENHLPSGILGITVCKEQHKKIILSEILDWWKPKTWNLIFIFIWISEI